jgi:hypothetical protein
MLFWNRWRFNVIPYYVTTLAIQLFKNSIDTQKKLRLNLHSLSVSVSELLEYGRKISNSINLVGLHVQFGGNPCFLLIYEIGVKRNRHLEF